MNKAELVYTLRKEAKEIDSLLKKLKERGDYLRLLADQIEATGKKSSQNEPPPNKFWKVIDKIYGEKK